MNAKLLAKVQLCKEALLNHGVVAFPTETVMGLGVIYNDYDAYSRLNKIKNRPETKPYTLMVSSVSEIDKYAKVDDKARKVVNAFMPGSITILLPAKNVPDYVTHSTGIIGVRVPTNEESIELLKAVELPLLVPSANKSGDIPALNSEQVIDIFGDELDMVIDGSSKGELPSTVVDLTGKEPVLIRKGPIPFEDIKKVYE